MVRIGQANGCFALKGGSYWPDAEVKCTCMIVLASTLMRHKQTHIMLIFGQKSAGCT